MVCFSPSGKEDTQRFLVMALKTMDFNSQYSPANSRNYGVKVHMHFQGALGQEALWELPPHPSRPRELCPSSLPSSVLAGGEEAVHEAERDRLLRAFYGEAGHHPGQAEQRGGNSPVHGRAQEVKPCCSPPTALEERGGSLAAGGLQSCSLCLVRWGDLPRLPWQPSSQHQQQHPCLVLLRFFLLRLPWKRHTFGPNGRLAPLPMPGGLAGWPYAIIIPETPWPWGKGLPKGIRCPERTPLPL